MNYKSEFDPLIVELLRLVVELLRLVVELLRLVVELLRLVVEPDGERLAVPAGVGVVVDPVTEDDAATVVGE